MRVLHGHSLGAVEDDPAEDTDAEFVDARRAWGQDEVRPVRQAARAILSREAERRAGVCEELLRALARRLVAKKNEAARNKSLATSVNLIGLRSEVPNDPRPRPH